MRRFKISLLAFQDRSLTFAARIGAANVRERFSRRHIMLALMAVVLAVAALAQTAAEKPSVDVRRVGSRLACQCGCKDSVATCSMLECSFSKPAKERIAQMQAVGMSDEQ